MWTYAAHGGDGCVDLVCRLLGQDKGAAVGFDHDVDRVERNGVVESRRRLQVRGSAGLTSTINSRSGSRPARRSSGRVAPRWSDRFTFPFSSGGAPWATMILGAKRASIGAN